jgi:hypothetical protein
MEKEEVISALQKLRPENGKYLTLEDIRKVPKLDFYIQLHFHNLGKALQAADLPMSKLAASMMITNEDLLNYLKDLESKLNHFPTTWEIAYDKELYKKYSVYKITWSIYKTRFGGLRNAKQLIMKKQGVVKVKNEKYLDKKKVIDDDFGKEKRRFWGKAAELHVTAELLYRGFQAANIPVDVGLDVLAVKKNKTYLFQVKHKDIADNKSISITKSSFERSGGGDVYFIFVLLTEEQREFLIVPYHIVNDWIRTGKAEETEKYYHLRIEKVDGNYLLKGTNLNNFRDSWDDIR